MKSLLFTRAATRALKVCLALSVVPVHSVAVAQDSPKPNIIFIFADDLGYGEVGCYGQERIKTPNLDQMAAEGLRYTQFYTGSPVCAPARGALLTGYHSGHGFVRGNGNPPLPAQPETLGTFMKKQGYSTGAIGKWGMGGVNSTGAPLRQGFDEFKGFIGQKSAHEHYPDFLYDGGEKWDIPEGTYANDLFTSEALDFVERHKDHPFFLYLPYTIPHQHIVVPSQGIYADKDWPEPERIKAAMITRMDHGIGMLFSRLKELGIDSNTLVFFTSDNGPHTEGNTDPEFFKSNGPLRGIKRDLYEGGIRVPMIVRWPDKIKAGATSDQQWALWDVLPTLLDIVNADEIPERDGISLEASLLEGTAVDHAPFYWEFHEKGFKQAIRKDDWKLVKTTTGALELYDLKSDIGETTNLSGKRPEIVMELMPLLSSMRTDSEHWKVSDAAKPKQKKQKKQKANKQAVKP